MATSGDNLVELQEGTMITNSVHHSMFPALLKAALEAKGRNERKSILINIGIENLNKCDVKVFIFGF